MEKRVVCVLRSSPEFQPRHVEALQRQLAKWAPSAKLVCLSDVAVPGVECIPLKYNWPDWWCKLEVFRPDVRGDFLLTDLDNVFLGPLDDVLSIGTYTTQLGESNALAFMTEGVRDQVWREFIRDPAYHMNFWHPLKTPVRNQFGDGGFIKSLATANTHWEEELPGQVINISQLGGRSGEPHLPFMPLLRSAFMPPDARVLLCWRPHRPWNVPAFRRFGMYQ